MTIIIDYFLTMVNFITCFSNVTVSIVRFNHGIYKMYEKDPK